MSWPGLVFEYYHYLSYLYLETVKVDIRVASGPWVNLSHFKVDDAGREVVDLDPYVGSDVQIRFHHYNANNSWYWHVDDVGVYSYAGPGIPFCFGDPGSGTPCPCGNDNDGSVSGSGCANGVFVSGAHLTGSGLASLSADTLILACSGLEPNNSGLYFQADNDLSPTNIWGDGL